MYSMKATKDQIIFTWHDVLFLAVIFGLTFLI